jgi:hypothetical protein
MYDEDAVVEIRISPRQAEELVNRLTNDMEFRERLAQDPDAELGHYGISIPPGLLPERVELPSPDELRRLHAQLDPEEVFGYPGKPFMLFCLILSGWFPRS